MDNKLVNKKAERRLLGLLLSDPDLLNEVDTEPEDFFDPGNRKAFEGMLDLFITGRAVEPLMLENWLASCREPPASPEKLVRDIMASAVPGAPAKDYARLLRDKAVRRRLHAAGREIQEMVFNGERDAASLADDAEAAVIGASAEGGTGETADAGASVYEAVRELREAAGQEGKLKGISTGFTAIDRLTQGLQKSNLIILAARPSMGKTALALNIAANAGVSQGLSVLFFSLEMSREDIVRRMITAGAMADMDQIRAGAADSRIWSAIDASAAALAGAPIAINDTPGLGLARMKAAASRVKARRGLDLIVIDYLQLMAPDSKRTENRQNEVSEISRGLKQLAREMDCPVLCLSQLARAPELRLDHHPKLSDLRDSGAIEQDADVVMFLYREAYYNEDGDANPNMAEIEIAKQRNGPTGSAVLGWLPEYTLFTNFSGEEEM